MTNGTLTKQIIKAAKTLTGAELAAVVTPIFKRWPMSSNYLLYNSDASKVPAVAWKTLVEVAVATDKQKGQGVNAELKAAGLAARGFGRWNGKA